MLILSKCVIFVCFQERAAAEVIPQTFLYKRPQSFGERFIGLFRHEIGIAHTLSRSFLWFQAAAFLRLPESTLAYQGDTLDTGKTHVVISSNDAIIPVEEVIDYLERGACPHTAVRHLFHTARCSRC